MRPARAAWASSWGRSRGPGAETAEGTGWRLVGVDLDTCIGAGAEPVAAWATAAMGIVGGYAEVSPSGTGIKLFALCAEAETGAVRAALGMGAGGSGRSFAARKRGGGGHPPAIEVHLERRYYAVTRDALDGEEMGTLGAGTAAALLAGPVRALLGRGAGRPERPERRRRPKKGWVTGRRRDGRDRPQSDRRPGRTGREARQLGGAAAGRGAVWRRIRRDRGRQRQRVRLDPVRLPESGRVDVRRRRGGPGTGGRGDGELGGTVGRQAVPAGVGPPGGGTAGAPLGPLGGGLGGADAGTGEDVAPPAAMPGGQDGGDWTAMLRWGETKEWRPNLHNALIALTEAPELRGMLAFNAFSDRITVLRCPPYETQWKGEREFKDHDRLGLAAWMQAGG